MTLERIVKSKVRRQRGQGYKLLAQQGSADWPIEIACSHVTAAVEEVGRAELCHFHHPCRRLAVHPFFTKF